MAEVVVVTGGTAGVGRAAARAFAEQGADVAVLARGRAGLDAVAAEIRAIGRRALAIPTDMADPEAVEAAAKPCDWLSSTRKFPSTPSRPGTSPTPSV